LKRQYDFFLVVQPQHDVRRFCTNNDPFEALLAFKWPTQLNGGRLPNAAINLCVFE
jgi:hypothetical protein